MRHQLLLSEFLTTPWALMPERLSALVGVITRWSQNIAAGDEVLASVRADSDKMAARKTELARAGNGSVAVLPMYGVIAQRANVEDISGPGVMSTSKFSQQLRMALADDSIGGILIDIDSPGGTVYGVGELADEIYQARSTKPVSAIANSLAASAAYWLGSSAGEFYVSPGGEVGSIGVWSAHEDYSRYLEELGIKTTLISAGEFKTEGHPYGPLSPQALDFMQGRVNDYYGAFTRSVARNRGTDVANVRENMGKGRVYGATDARGAGMVDGIATFDQVVRKMQRAIGGNGAGATKTALARKELDILGA